MFLKSKLRGHKVEAELIILEWDILNPDYLIWLSNGYTLDFLLKPVFLEYSTEKLKTVFLNLRVPPVSVYNLKLRNKFHIYWLYIRDSDWLNFIHFSGYNEKILKKERIHHSEGFSSVMSSKLNLFLLSKFTVIYTSNESNEIEKYKLKFVVH